MSLQNKRIILPLLLVLLLFSTLIYGYHGDYNLSFGRPPPSPGFGGDYDDEKFPRPPKHGDKRPKPPGAAVWTPRDIAAIPKQPYTLHNEYRPGPIEPNEGESFEDRLRYETGDTWRPKGSLLDPSTGVKGLARLMVPPRSSYSSDGDFLRQSIIGDFGYGSDKVFYMLKTGADTQWKRMPMHFMTDLTHVQNFALYSDAPGSIFGHEIIDVVKELPPQIIKEQYELKRYRAHLQAHNEHWNWAPEDLMGEGGWLVDRYKNIPMLLDAYKKNPNCEWYLWVDDDSYIFYDTLVKWLDTMDPNEMIYTGATAGLRFEGEFFYFAHGGSAVAVSHAIVEALFGPPNKRRHNYSNKELLDKWAVMATGLCCGDALIAYMLLKELDVTLYEHPEIGGRIWFGGPFQGESIESIVLTPERLCGPIATWHHLSPHDTEVLYTYERLWKHDRAILYDDIYRDFFLPYIVEERPNWWIGESGRMTEYPEEGRDPNEPVQIAGQTLQPALKKEDCKAACAAHEKCGAWSWKPDYCILQTTGFSFGSAANSWNKKTGCVSGWMVERIRQWRVISPCDPLKWVNETFDDDESTSEGWMLRKIANETKMESDADDSTLPPM